MAALADAIRNADLDALLGSGHSVISAGTVYIGLSTTTPVSDGTGITEPSGSAYARVAVTNNSTNFPNASAGSKANGTQFTFPTATGSWGTVTYWVMFDAASSGNFLMFGALLASVAVTSGVTLVFPIGAFTVGCV